MAAEDPPHGEQPDNYSDAVSEPELSRAFKAADEFDVPVPEGSRGADEVELEALHGTEVWDSAQGSIAGDWVKLRHMQRSDDDFGMFGQLIGADEVRRLLGEARIRGDKGERDWLLGEHYAADPGWVGRVLREAEQAGENGDLDDLRSPGADEESDPPVSLPLPSAAGVKGPTRRPRWRPSSHS